MQLTILELKADVGLLEQQCLFIPSTINQRLQTISHIKENLRKLMMIFLNEAFDDFNENIMRKEEDKCLITTKSLWLPGQSKKPGVRTIINRGKKRKRS